MIPKKALDVLHNYWGYSQFRGLQVPIISNVLAGKNTIGLLPTGGGKSICYQVPGLCLEGVTLVISPLLALMQDQLHGLESRGISGYQFTGSYSPRQLDQAFSNIRNGGYKFVFLAPERLQNKLFLEYIKNANVSLIAVDEAHCVSQWGFDFRPSYLNVQILRELLPNTTVLALTASATKRVKGDLQDQLLLHDAEMFEGSLRRENLILHKHFTPNKNRQLLRILERTSGTGIIYAKTRASCERLSSFLCEKGYASTFFHAGLDLVEKNKRQEQWIKNEVPIMVSTTAFGMGIDKSDVSWVMHWDVPDTIEGYYQEVGRGGRGGQEALTHLLYNQQDFSRIQKSIDELPNPEAIESFYFKACSHFQIAVGAGEGHQVSFSLVDLAAKFQLSLPIMLDYIRLLQQRGVWQFIESNQSYPEILLKSNPSDWKQLDASDYESLVQIYRIYSSSLEGSTRIDLYKLGAILHMKPLELNQWLIQMHQKGMVHYKPEDNNCGLLFLVDRIDKRYFKLSKSFIDAWITSKRERSKAILDFLQSEECLHITISNYFGQDEQQPCGRCSNCTIDHYPDQDKVASMLKEGFQIDDIWLDLNCSPDALKRN